MSYQIIAILGLSYTYDITVGQNHPVRGFPVRASPDDFTSSPRTGFSSPNKNTGCDDFGTIYTLDDASSISMSINACGDCDDVGDCLDDLSFYCPFIPRKKLKRIINKSFVHP